MVSLPSFFIGSRFLHCYHAISLQHWILVELQLVIDGFCFPAFHYWLLKLHQGYGWYGNYTKDNASF